MSSLSHHSVCLLLPPPLCFYLCLSLYTTSPSSSISILSASSPLSPLLFPILIASSLLVMRTGTTSRFPLHTTGAHNTFPDSAHPADEDNSGNYLFLQCPGQQKSTKLGIFTYEDCIFFIGTTSPLGEFFLVLLLLPLALLIPLPLSLLPFPISLSPPPSLSPLYNQHREHQPICNANERGDDEPQ
ncbi:hypothetical protein B0H10DRAFT_2230785 [Mycena sp. CBHHK59/15]|nr:hypothetical protein B0H10DRAFT_2230785 [Mycena sp. CBHHK59/15]